MQAVKNGTAGPAVRWRALMLAAMLGTGLATTGVFAAGTDMSARVAGLESRASDASATLDGLSSALSAFMPPATIGASSVAPSEVAPILVAQSRDNSTLAVRLDQLEEQMRLINGQVEGLQFQLTQLQTLLERMQEDTDARFAALEGGVAPGKTSAAPQTGGAMPAGEAPQALDLSLPSDAGGSGTSFDGGFSTDNGFGSDDPNDAPIELGAPERPLGTLTLGDLSNASGPEIDIGSDSTFVTDADADAQYKAGYDAVVRGDYEFAEDQFRQFIGLFPDHPMAPDATNWLGEALIQRGDYEEAANILLSGFQSYPNSTRAPDILMKLGIALVGQGENETACRTYTEVLRRYPDVSAAFKQRLSDEMAKAQC